MPTRPILLTGATGFVGALVLDRLLRDGHEVVCLVRADDDAQADARLRGVLDRVGAPRDAAARAVRGDLTERGLGLGPRRAALAAELGTVVHAAASVSFALGLEESRAINVAGTRRVLDLAAEAGGLERVVHVSTAYVAGARRGRVTEDDTSHGRFRNAYEQSKREAEDLVRASGLPHSVLRPSIVVGDRATGWTNAFNVLYVPVRAFAAGRLPVLPARRGAPVDVVSVDYVADAVAALALHPDAEGGTFHLVAGDRASTVGELVALGARRFARRRPLVVPPRLVRRHLGRMQQFAPYFAMRQRFDDTHARALLEPLGIEPSPLRDYFDTLMDYAETTAWGRRPRARPAPRAAPVPAG